MNNKMCINCAHAYYLSTASRVRHRLTGEPFKFQCKRPNNQLPGLSNAGSMRLSLEKHNCKNYIQYEPYKK